MSTESEERNKATVREANERTVRRDAIDRLEGGRIVRHNAEAGLARAIAQARAN